MTLILSGTNGVSDIDGDASTPAVRGTDANTGIFFGADTIGFAEGGAEAMRIDSSGRLLLGTSTAGSNQGMTIYNATQGELRLQNSTTGNTASDGFQIAVSGNDAFVYNRENAALIFGTNDTERMRLNATGNLAFVNGNGIDFSASAGGGATSSILDDYEEGTFTPVAIGATTAGTGTYTTQSGRYTKIGQVCTFQFTIGWSAHTGTGYLRFDGLPFTSLGGGVPGQSAATLGYNSGLAFTDQPVLYISNASTLLTPTQTNTSGVVSVISMDTSVAELIISGHYIVA